MSTSAANGSNISAANACGRHAGCRWHHANGRRPLGQRCCARSWHGDQRLAAPKVFTAHDGIETYSAQFFVRWTDVGGVSHVKRLTPQVNRGLRGPYNRRNAYGAMIAGGPMLDANAATRDMHAAALSYTRCGAGSPLDELGIDRRTITGPVIIELLLRTATKGDRNWRLALNAVC